MVLTDMIEVYMTDYCYNEIVFYGKHSDINDLTDFLGEENGGFSFNKICPEPVHKDEDWDWYEWRTQNWSTKWECENVQREKFSSDEWSYLYVKFDCPWYLPLNILTKISEIFPHIHMTFSWTLENQSYQTRIGVRHSDKGWNNLYYNEFNCIDKKYDEDQYLDLVNSTYKGFIYNELYTEMINLDGFQKSLEMIRFRDNWIDNSEII